MRDEIIKSEKVKLFHVSTHNKELKILDMSIRKKNDFQYVKFLLDSASSFESFFSAFESDIVEACSDEKKWNKEKMAAEAIFEFIRSKYYFDSPSRLSYAYFSDDYNKAKQFNTEHRKNQGAIFEFMADIKEIYHYDMDIFEEAVTIFRKGLTRTAYDKVIKLALIYWKQSWHGNTEILYKGYPIINRID